MIMGRITIGNVIGPVIAGIVGGLGEWRQSYWLPFTLAVIGIIVALFLNDEKLTKVET